MPWLFSHVAFSLLLHNFWYVVALALFSPPLKKKDNFALRVFFSLVFILAYVFASGIIAEIIFSFIPFTSVNFSVYFVVIFTLTLVLYFFILKFSFKINTAHCVCVAVSLYACTYLVSGIYEYILEILGLDFSFSLLEVINPLNVIAYFFIRLVLFLLLDLLFIKRLRSLQAKYQDSINKWVLVLFVLILITTVISTVVSTVSGISSVGGDSKDLIANAFSILSILFYAMVILIQFAFFETAKYKRGEDYLRQLRESEKYQFDIAKQSMDIINLKCHDLKHQIRTALSNQPIDPKFIDEVERNIFIYDSHYNTGNKTLDVFLTDKALRLKSRGVCLMVIADGAALDFLEEYDLNSIFGNLIDNAFDYLIALNEETERFIRINCKKYAGGVSVLVENYFKGSLTLKSDGLPKTSKGDEDWHGFGLKSVKDVVESYGGAFSIAVEDDLFKAKIFFPYGSKKIK